VQIHTGLPHFAPDRKRVVTTGTFDGVHLGHRALLNWMVQEAQSQEAETVVLTFDPHPRSVLFGEDSGLQLLQTLNQRAACLASTGLDHLVIQPFDIAFSRLRPEEFVRDVLVRGMGTTTIAVGHDHRFGAGREGDVDLLRNCGESYGFDVVHIPAHIEGELTVSSTKVRQRIQDGNMDEAARLLGRTHAWRGKVVEGEGRGRKLGFRTANLAAIEPLQLLPPTGVYAARFHLLDPQGFAVVKPGWSAMVHIGPRPTFEDESGPSTIEAHLFDADDPHLYGSSVELSFVERIRDIQKFDGPADLVAQLEADTLAAKRALGYV
jgi:riboflavin kinase/FMN adenylyltransferase